MPDGDGWPPNARGRTVRQCLGTVLIQEWARHGFCVRDLDLAESGPQKPEPMSFPLSFDALAGLSWIS